MLPLLLVFAPVSLEAQGRRAGSQEDRDSLVRLISADMARLVEVDGQQYRKVVGNAVFLHNGTYLRCDSAYWNVSGEYIDAKGHIRIEQDGTLLTGDSIKYDIPSNTARFRGHLVELIDRDSNILRTNYLDYNTKDSTAFFYRGGAMKDADGNLIESVTGRYSSPDERFDFIGQVEMFSDSLFFVCDSLEYNTGNEVAVFRGSTRGWYGDNEISAGAGRYERTVEKFYFRRDVHILTAEYELWCDTLYYDRAAEYSRLLGNVQLLDTVDNALALAGELRFWNTPRRAELYREPALVLVNEEEGGARDSIFMASDFMLYYTKRMFEIDSAVVAEARQRYESAQVDPLEQKKSKDAAGRSSGGAAGRQLKSSGGGGASAVMKSPGTLPMPYGPYEDTLSVADTVAVPPPPDTTEVSFLEAYHNVRIFKSDIQVKCDSLLFGSIDSIARLYTAPVLWYEIKSQITADQYKEFYKSFTYDFKDPLDWLHISVDSPVQFQALLFIPDEEQEFKGPREDEYWGIDLYCNRVLIQHKNKDLIPPYLGFLKGIVDTEDIPLNISRETLQENVVLRKINQTIVKQTLGHLEKMAKDKPEEYLKFWKHHGTILKFGVHQDFAQRDRLLGLLRFNTSAGENEESVSSLAEYMERGLEGQKTFWYVTAPNREAAKVNPYMDRFRKKGVEVLFFYEALDEVVVSGLGNYKDWNFKSIENAEEKDLEAFPDKGEEAPKASPLSAEDEKTFDDLVNRMKEILGDKVKSVVISSRLTDSAAVLSSEDGVTSAMEKFMRAMDKNMTVPVKTLEVNREHPLLRALLAIYKADSHDAVLTTMVNVLFDSAQMMDGFIRDPQELARRSSQLLEQSAAWYTQVTKA